MRWVSLLLCVLFLLAAMPMDSEHASATPDYKTRLVNSFETGVEEITDYGSWESWTLILFVGSASVTQDITQQMHGLYSACLNASTFGGGYNVRAALNFTSNASMGVFLVDHIIFSYRTSGTSEEWWSGPLSYVYFQQWNGTTLLEQTKVDLWYTPAWVQVTLEPDWQPGVSHWVLQFNAFAVAPSNFLNLNIDYFRIESEAVDVRLRYWNIYTGLGYYTEKLLARYYTFEDGWIDVWDGEFEAYKGDEVLVSVTDIFQRNVWTGIVVVDSSPVYVDIMVPIVTVHIGKPDWYNDSVPMEWRVTCLPWGPDGPGGMTLPAIGFEFEVLAGWYNLAWLDNGVVSAGNQSFLVEGNATEFRGTMVLSDLSIPMDPDYEVVVEGDDGRIFDIKDFDDLIALCAALYEDDRVKAALLISGLTGLLLALYRFNRAATKKAQGLKGGD